MAAPHRKAHKVKHLRVCKPHRAGRPKPLLTLTLRRRPQEFNPNPKPLPSGTSPPSADGILANGVLTVPGVDPDNQTAPGKFSKRTNAADQLPIAAYALQHLSKDQKTRIFQTLHRAMAISGHAPPIESAIGAVLTYGVVFHSLRPLPDELTRGIPELTGLAFVQNANKVLLVSPTMQRVLAVVEK